MKWSSTAGLMCKGDVLDLGLGESSVESWQSETASARLTAHSSHPGGSACTSLFSSKPSSTGASLTGSQRGIEAQFALRTDHANACCRQKNAPEDIPWSTIASINLSKPVAHPDLRPRMIGQASVHPSEALKPASRRSRVCHGRTVGLRPIGLRRRCL